MYDWYLSYEKVLDFLFLDCFYTNRPLIASFYGYRLWIISTVLVITSACNYLTHPFTHAYTEYVLILNPVLWEKINLLTLTKYHDFTGWDSPIGSYVCGVWNRPQQVQDLRPEPRESTRRNDMVFMRPYFKSRWVMTLRLQFCNGYDRFFHYCHQTLKLFWSIFRYENLSLKFLSL